MEKEKDLYIRLFYPLEDNQKKDTCIIWKDNIEKDFSIKYKKIEKYCKENDCDIMMALYRIYQSFNFYYICSSLEYNNPTGNDKYDYFTKVELTDFVKNRIKKRRVSALSDKLIGEIDSNIETMFKVLDKEKYYGFDQAKELGFNDFNIISIDHIYQNIEDRERLKEIISELIEQRRASPDIYINDKPRNKVKIDINSLPEYPLTGFEELMYLPYDSKGIVIEDETKQREELKNFNKDGLKQFIVDFLLDELFLNNEKSIRGYPRKLFDDLSKEWTILKEQENEEQMLKNLNNKIFEIRTSNNYLFIQWQNANFPLLTTKCKEKKINVVLDLVLDIVRKDNNEVIYNSDNAISDYLNGGKQLINKNNKLEEIDLIEWLVHYYYINYNYYPGDTDIFKKNIDGVKKCIGDFMFLYIEYMLHTRFRFEYLLNKENEPTYNNEGSTQVVKKEQEKQKVEIDVDALKEYFKPQFKQQDVDSSNFDTLINDLRGDLSSYTKNDITAIASLIYKSDKLLLAKKPATFNKWLKAFCSMINKDVPKSKPSGVKKQIGILSETFYYLKKK